MKRLLVMTTLVLAAVSTSGWAQAPTGDDPHHASQGASSAPVAAEKAQVPEGTQRPAPANSPQGSGRDMMKEMQDMPAHNHADHDTCCSVKKSDHAQ